MKDVAIIITCYNYGKYLTEAINSCLAQTIPCEIIVVDDGSTDDTRNICTPYLDKIVYLYKVNEKTNAASKNYGIEHTSSPYIITLDADDILLPDFVEKALKMIDKHDFVTFNAQEFELSEKINYSSGLNESIYNGNNILYCAMFTRACWEAVGGFDEDVPISGIEDWTFWIKFLRAGYINYNTDEIGFKYRVHEGSMTQTNIAPNGHIFREWMLKKEYLS